MKNIYVTSIIGNEKRYLQSIYPIIWTPFISGATKFTSLEEARLTMNCIYKNLFSTNDDEYNEFTIESLYSITFLIVENGVIIGEVPYILKGV